MSGKEFTNIFKETRIAKNDLAAFERINVLISEGKEPAKALGVEWSNLSKSNQEMSRQLVKSNKPLEEVKQGFQSAAQSASKMTLASKAATLGMKALSIAINVGIMLVISAGIAKIVELAQANDKLRDSAIETANDLATEVDSLDAYKSKISDLRSALDSGNLSQTEAYNKRKELMDIQDEIIEKYGKEAGSIDLVTGSLEKQIGALDELTQSKYTKWMQDNQKAINNANQYLSEPVTSDYVIDFVGQEEIAKLIQSEVDKLGASFSDVTQSDNGFSVMWRFDDKNREDLIKSYRELYDSVQEYGKNTNSEMQDQISTTLASISSQINQYDNEAFKENTAVFDQATEATVFTTEQYRNIYAEALSAKEEYNEAVAKQDDEATANALNKISEVESRFAGMSISDIGVSEYLGRLFDEINSQTSKDRFALNLKINKDGLESEIQNALNDLNGLDDIGIINIGKDTVQGTDAQEASFVRLKEKADEYEVSVQSLIDWLVELGLVQSRPSDTKDIIPSVSTKELEDARKATDTLVSSAKSLSSAFEEQRENGRLSAETILGIVDAGYAAALQVDQETGVVTINREAYLALAQAKIQEQIASLQTQRSAIVSELIAEAEAAKIAAGGHLTNAQAIQIENAAKSSNANIQALDAQIEALNQIDLSRVTSGLYHVGNAAKNAANEMKQAMQSAQSAINSLLTMTMKMVKQRYDDEKDRLQDQMDRLKDRYDDEKDALEDVNKEKERQYKKDRDAIESQRKSLKAKLDAELEILRAKKEEYYWDKETKENNKTISEIKSELEIATKDDSLEGLARQKELQEQLAKAEEEWKDKQFDHSIESQTEALQKEFDLADEKHQNELDNLERIEELRKQNHQDELDRIEHEYEADREALERDIENIEEATRKEGQIREEAIALINASIHDKSSQLYADLIAWNKDFGSSIDADVRVAWDNAYAALDKFNQYGEIDVRATLEHLALAMNDIVNQTHNAASAMRDLANAQREFNGQLVTEAQMRKELAGLKKHNANVSGKYDDRIIEIEQWLKDLDGYDKGGVDTTGGLKMMHGTPSSPEVVFNASDAKKLYEYVRNTPDLSKGIAERAHAFINNAPDIVAEITRSMNMNLDRMNPFKQMNMMPPAAVGDIVVHQGDINVQGSMDKTTLKDIRQIFRDNADELAEIVLGSVMKKQHLKGHGNMKY